MYEITTSGRWLMEFKEQGIYYWHDCLDCKFLPTTLCPLEGEGELDKIEHRITMEGAPHCLRFKE